MKHGNVFFMELSRGIFDEKHKDISIGAKLLFVYLNELEQRYCNGKNDQFYRTDSELAKDLNISIGTLKKYKKELKEKASDLVFIGVEHKEVEPNKHSEKCFTIYRILQYYPLLAKV